MLDSVDPDAVRAAMAHAGDVAVHRRQQVGLDDRAERRWPPRRSAASSRPGTPQWGSRFVAITDEGTALHRARDGERFRDVFVNPSDIGGRYSALSFFGMVPAALMGVDLDALLAGARAMESACRAPDAARQPRPRARRADGRRRADAAATS